MSTGRALGTLGAVIVVVAAFLALAAWAGVREYWAGFLFLLQWSMMEETKPDRLPRSALGAATGLAIASLPLWLAPVLGAGAATGVLLAAALLATFLLIRGAAGLLVNAATMLFLTVATIPHIAAATTPLDLYIGLGAGIVYFGGLALVAAAITRPRIGPPEASNLAT